MFKALLGARVTTTNKTIPSFKGVCSLVNRDSCVYLQVLDKSIWKSRVIALREYSKFYLEKRRVG